jgi:hypothetical protein
MRPVLVTCVLGLSLCLLACGNNYQHPVNLSGNWDASLFTASGKTVFAFSTTLREIGGSILTGSNVTFNPSTPCYESPNTGSGAVQFSSGGYGYYSGGTTTAMSLTIKGTSSGATETLNLQGRVNPDNTVSGTWTSTGASAACSGSGAFTMIRTG